jgi:hypothetical protein
MKVQTMSSQPYSDRANRIFNGISWTAEVAGAIHKTTIRGKVA